jgi:protein-S-isoprenylcysteine O-methyltransferase Ste14
MPANDYSIDRAGVVAPAPVFYLVPIALAAAAEFLIPTSLLPSRVGVPLAVVLIVTSIALVTWAVRALAAAHTAFDARKSTTALVVSGPFRLSRNPTYLSLTLLQLGLAFAAQSAWLLIAVVPAVIATHWCVIRREERYLEAKFGEEYRNYAATVRRWI